MPNRHKWFDVKCEKCNQCFKIRSDRFKKYYLKGDKLCPKCHYLEFRKEIQNERSTKEA